MTDYSPGECNIGDKEKRNRAILGVSGLIAATLMVGVIVQQGLPNFILLFTFIPLLLGFEGIFQALNSFCVHYAHKGVYNEGNGLKQVNNSEDHEKDKRKAKRIHKVSIAASAIVTAMLYLIMIML